MEPITGEEIMAAADGVSRPLDFAALLDGGAMEQVRLVSELAVSHLPVMVRRPEVERELQSQVLVGLMTGYGIALARCQDAIAAATAAVAETREELEQARRPVPARWEGSD